MTKFILALLILVGGFKFAEADIRKDVWPTSGSLLFSMCERVGSPGEPMEMTAQCLNFIRGVVAGMNYQAQKDHKCVFNIPDHVTIGDAEEVIMAWMISHRPLVHSMSAETVIEQVVEQQYPCK